MGQSASTDPVPRARLCLSPEELAYRLLVRVPLGAVLLEEIAFRGVLAYTWDPNDRWGSWSDNIKVRDYGTFNIHR